MRRSIVLNLPLHLVLLDLIFERTTGAHLSGVPYGLSLETDSYSIKSFKGHTRESKLKGKDLYR
jgi:hypothetical protein